MHPTGNIVSDTICHTWELQLTITNAAAVAVEDQCPNCAHCGTRTDRVTCGPVDPQVEGFPTRLHVQVPASPSPTTSAERIFYGSLL